MLVQGRRYSTSPFIRFSLPLALLLLAFAVRAIGLSARSLWYDEGYTVLFAKHDLAYLLTQTAGLELNTPLHYIVLHGWMAAAGDSEFVVRLLSVFAGVITVALAGALARFVVPSSVPSSVAARLLAMTFVAIWPVCVALSQEVRMYGLLICLSTLSVVVLMGTMRSRSMCASCWLIWGLCNLAAFATHVLAALVFGAQGVVLMGWWLSGSRGQRPTSAVFSAVATGALMVIWIVYIVGYSANYGTTYTAKLDYSSLLVQSLASIYCRNCSLRCWFCRRLLFVRL